MLIKIIFEVLVLDFLKKTCGLRYANLYQGRNFLMSYVNSIIVSQWTDRSKYGQGWIFY